MIKLGNDQSSYTEGVVKEVLGAANDYADKVKDDFSNDKLGTIRDDIVNPLDSKLDAANKAMSNQMIDKRSIVARARNSILQFPVYVTQSLRVNEAQIIAGLFERVYTSLVQATLSQNAIINEEEANNLVFLKNFHTNINESSDIVMLMNEYYSPIDDIDQIMKESVFYKEQVTESMDVTFSVIPTKEVRLIKENARLMNEPLTGFMFEATETTERSSYKNETLSEKDLREMAKEKAGLTKRAYQLYDMSEAEAANSVKAKYANAKDVPQSEIDDILDEKKKIEAAVEAELRQLKDDIKAGKIKDYKYANGKYMRTTMTKDVSKRTTPDINKAPEIIRAVDAPKILRDVDIKKINNMLPYSIEATFRIKAKNGELAQEVRYILGIKSVLHLIRVDDLSDELEDLVTGNIRSLQKVRYKTGEIKFMDYFANIKNIKKDAIKSINTNKRWITRLKKLAEFNKLHGTMFKKITDLSGKDVPIPNATLILSQSDVTILTNETGIDLSKVSNAKKLCRSLFLIAIAIVDSSAGTMRVLFPDSDEQWDVQSLAAIDAELAKTDNSQLMKELNRIVNR